MTEDLYQSGKNSFLWEKPNRSVTASQHCALCQRCGERLLQASELVFFYLLIYVSENIYRFIYLAVPDLPGGMQDLHCSTWDL